MPGTTRRATLRHPRRTASGPGLAGSAGAYRLRPGRQLLRGRRPFPAGRRPGARTEPTLRQPCLHPRHLPHPERAPTGGQPGAARRRSAAGAGQRTGPGAATGRAPARRRGFQSAHGRRPVARATAHPAHRRQRADGRPPARRAAGQPRADLHCPVRAQNDAHALERLRQAARQHRIELAESDCDGSGPTPPTSPNQASDYRRKPTASWPAASTRSSIPPAR